MDEAQAFLLSSLRSFSGSLPAGLSSTRDIDSDSLFSIVAQSIRLLDSSSSSSAFPASLPLSMAGKVGACSAVASALKKLGFRGDLDFFLVNKFCAMHFTSFFSPPVFVVIIVVHFSFFVMNRLLASWACLFIYNWYYHKCIYFPCLVVIEIEFL